MTFHTTLFRALAAADIATCNGIAVVAKLIEPDPLLSPYVDLADGTTIYIEDVQISVDGSGRSYSRAAMDDRPGLVWRFERMQPLRPQCVETLDAPPPPELKRVVQRLRVAGDHRLRRA